jgi:5-methylcytosine-specific restriction enzyme A
MRWLSRAPFDGKPRLANGRWPCRWCGGEVPKGRRRWCSDACVQEFTVRRGSGWVRRLVAERDRGVCAVCGLDTRRLERIMGHLDRGHYHRWGGRHGAMPEEVRKRRRRRYAELIAAMRQRGWHDPTRRSLWDADHIVPVVEGGGACGLDNYQTLCVPCHKAATKALAARRARSRNPQMELC